MIRAKVTSIEEIETPKGTRWKVHLDVPGPDGKPFIVVEGRPGKSLTVGAELKLTPPTPMPAKKR